MVLDSNIGLLDRIVPAVLLGLSLAACTSGATDAPPDAISPNGGTPNRLVQSCSRGLSALDEVALCSVIRAI